MEAGAVAALHVDVGVRACPDFDPIFVIEANFDGPPGPFWAQMEATLGPASADAALLQAPRGWRRTAVRRGHQARLALSARALSRDEDAAPQRLPSGQPRAGARPHPAAKASCSWRPATALAQADPTHTQSLSRHHRPSRFTRSCAPQLLGRVSLAGDAGAGAHFPAPNGSTIWRRFLGFVFVALLLPVDSRLGAGADHDDRGSSSSCSRCWAALVGASAVADAGAAGRRGRPDAFRRAHDRQDALQRTKLIPVRRGGGGAVLVASAAFVVASLLGVARSPRRSPARISTRWGRPPGRRARPVQPRLHAPALVLWLRWLERRDPSQDAPPVDERLLREMAHREDWIPQNHMGSVVLVKPGMLRMALFRAGHLRPRPAPAGQSRPTAISAACARFTSPTGRS